MNKMMKHRVKMIAIVVVIVVMYALASYIDTHYTREAVVVHPANNYYAVAVDNAGNEWEFCADNVFVNQKVKLKMHTNNTNSIYDDKVIGVEVIAEAE
jgi:hypothetical protein